MDLFNLNLNNAVIVKRGKKTKRIKQEHMHVRRKDVNDAHERSYIFVLRILHFCHVRLLSTVRCSDPRTTAATTRRVTGLPCTWVSPLGTRLRLRGFATVTPAGLGGVGQLI
jgi:hypothetical protein